MRQDFKPAWLLKFVELGDVKESAWKGIRERAVSVLRDRFTNHACTALDILYGRSARIFVDTPVSQALEDARHIAGLKGISLIGLHSPKVYDLRLSDLIEKALSAMSKDDVATAYVYLRVALKRVQKGEGAV